MLVEHMTQGFSFASFGAIAGVSEVTLHQWVKDHPDFKEAKAVAELKSLLWWETQGMDGLFVIGENKKFTAAVWIFTMKARFVKYGYRDNHDVVDDDAEKARGTSTERLLKIVRNAAK